ncbi:MAG: HAMP domain-containing protein [Armatimonadetes bacterium]|nr:HAMP domain-containing protein [Armatimonadota bacterium]
MPFLPRLRMRLATKLFWSHLLAIILVSGSVGTFFYDRAVDSLLKSLRSRLQNSAALLSDAVEAKDLDGIQGPADMGGERYEHYLQVLRRMRRTNPDISFLYVMRQVGGKAVFVIDSDESERQAKPGKVYDEANDLMMTGFSMPSVDKELVRDEWGVFLSGYAPLRDGEGKYLVGIDMRADEVDAKLRELRLWGMVSLLTSLLLALFFSLGLSQSLTRRAAVLAAHCREISAGDFGTAIDLQCHDEYDDLIAAFNAMRERLLLSHQQTRSALDDVARARDGLEQAVAERTAELQEALDRVGMLSGLLPICCSCHKVRDDQGYWQRVEAFIEAHSTARFSHGICPECTVKLYGDLLADDPPKGA